MMMKDKRDLEKLGIRFLRFDDIEVKKNMSNVLRVIEDWIEKNNPPLTLRRSVADTPRRGTRKREFLQ